MGRVTRGIAVWGIVPSPQNKEPSDDAIISMYQTKGENESFVLILLFPINICSGKKQINSSVRQILPLPIRVVGYPAAIPDPENE